MAWGDGRLDLGLSDMSGFDLLEVVKTDPDLGRIPVVIYTGRDLTRREEARLAASAEAVIVEGTAAEIDDAEALKRLAPVYHRKYAPWKLDASWGSVPMWKAATRPVSSRAAQSGSHASAFQSSPPSAGATER